MRKLLIVAVVLVGLGAGVWYLEQPHDGVAPVVWDEATCSHCHMHLGDRNFAAQLQTKDGEVHNFDDPGCLFEWVGENAPSIKNAYFRHHERDAWLDYREVGFVEADAATPMGYGLGAVAKAAELEAMSFEEASNAVFSGTYTGSREHESHEAHR